MKYLVYETSLDGHRRHYLSVIDQDLASDGGEWIYFLPEKGEISLKNGTLQQKIGSHSSKGMGSALARLRFLFLAIVSCRPNKVLIPTGDGLAQFLFLLSPLFLIFGCKVICVLHRAKFGYPVKNTRDRLIHLFSYITFRCAFRCTFLSVDVVPCEALKTGANPLGLKIGYLPDPLSSPPAKEKSASRTALGLSHDLEIFGCVGVIDQRKGADSLIRAASNIGGNQRILLAGKFAPEILAQLETVDSTTQSRLILINRFLDHDEMFSYICALDAMLMVQHGHTGISSFALHAVKYGIPLLCSATPWFHELQKQFPEVVTLAENGGNLGCLIASWGKNCQRGHTPDEKFSQKYSRMAFAAAVAKELNK